MSISIVDPNHKTPESCSPPRISRPIPTKPTPTPGCPKAYHFTEMLEEKTGQPGGRSRLDSNTRKKVKRTFERDAPISILPPGGEALIAKLTPHLPDITTEGRQARNTRGLKSPVRKMGQLEVHLHTSSDDSRNRRKFTVKTTEGDQVTFGQHVQQDAQGNIHNSLYPIDGEIQGNPVICTTGKKAKQAWDKYHSSPLKRRNLYSRLSDVAHGAQGETSLKEPDLLPFPNLP